MARAMWKGVVTFDDLRIPVKLYAAVEDRTVHFRLLHEADHVPVKQRMVSSATGEPVEAEEIRKGYQVEEGVFVLLSQEELAELEPPASRDIEITRFVDPSAINHQWYARPYFLGPDGDEELYFAFAEALAREGKEAVARWVMRKKRYVGALRASGGYLALISLRPAEEVVVLPELSRGRRREPDPKEVALAQQLVEALAGDFEPAAYHDEYHERLCELIEAKSEGRAVELEAPRERPSARSLADSLRQSLSAAREASLG